MLISDAFSSIMKGPADAMRVHRGRRLCASRVGNEAAYLHQAGSQWEKQCGKHPTSEVNEWGVGWQEHVDFNNRNWKLVSLYAIMMCHIHGHVAGVSMSRGPPVWWRQSEKQKRKGNMVIAMLWYLQCFTRSSWRIGPFPKILANCLGKLTNSIDRFSKLLGN